MDRRCDPQQLSLRGIMHNSHLKRAGVDAKFIFGNPEEMVDELKALSKALRQSRI